MARAGWIGWMLTLLLGLPGGAGAGAQESHQAETLAADRALLEREGQGSDRETLLRLFRGWTPTPGDQDRLQGLVAQLGSDSFDEREEASAALRAAGPLARPFLERVATSKDLEVQRRARECLESLENGPGAALPMAAARLLARQPGRDAVEVLLAYLPHAREEIIVDTVLEALAHLVAGTQPVPAELVQACTASDVRQRSAAGYLLGRQPEEEHQQRARRLLADREPLVRFRTVQGLLAAHRREGVPVLIDLLTAPLGDRIWEVEDILIRLAREDAPPVADVPAARLRQARREAWLGWWKEHGKDIDLARLTERPPHLGLTLVPEMHRNKVWECARDGKMLWEVAVPGCPIDAQVLPGGRILVAELNGHRVTERDRSGKVLWEHGINTPIACQRLANGNTWIATNQRFFVVTPAGKEVSSYAPENTFFIHSVQRLRNGHVVCVSMEGEVREIDTTGKVVRKIPLPIQGGWSGVEAVSPGRYLVCNMGAGKVLEIDIRGKTLWEYQWPGACYASRLPSGNTLVVSNSGGLREVDRRGKTVWERDISSSLWRAHRR